MMVVKMIVQTKLMRRKSSKLAEAVEAVMAGSTDTIMVPTVQVDSSIEEQVHSYDCGSYVHACK